MQTVRMDITPTRLSEAAGISVPYACQIIGGKRTPPRALAVHIYQRTGWRHETLADFDEAQITAFAEMQPWTPRSTPQVAA